MKIDEIEIGEGCPPAIIAELSGNHNGSLETALRIADEAKNAGADFLKLQTYRPDTITLDVAEGEFVISDPKSLWYGKSLHALYEQAHTPWEWQAEIFAYCKSIGLPCFSSAFDETAVEFLEKLDVCAYKVASQEIVHIPLIRKIAETGKPIILSTGMASLSEIEEAVNTIVKHGTSEFCLLKCSSSYPAPPEFSNLSTIPLLKKIFGCPVGLSDHTIGVGVPIAAVAVGADMVEKHITLDRNDGGIDSGFSSTVKEMRQMILECKSVAQAMGEPSFGPTEADKASMNGRRSIYISNDIKAGEKLTTKNIKIVRPNLGLAPRYFDVVLGRRASRDLTMGTALTWDAFD